MPTETSVQHTPGPWSSADTITDGLVVTANAGMTDLADFIADECGHAVAVANARLAAAAPDMLAALKDAAAHMESLARHLTSGSDANALDARARQARAAVRKAEGVRDD